MSQQRNIAIWAVSSRETSGTDVQASCACQQQAELRCRPLELFRKLHPTRPRFMRSSSCPPVGVQAKEATRTPKQPNKSQHTSATPFRCTTLLSQLHARTTVQLQMECLSIFVTHPSAPFSLPRSVDPWRRNVAPLVNGAARSFNSYNYSSTQDDCSSSWAANSRPTWNDNHGESSFTSSRSEKLRATKFARDWWSTDVSLLPHRTALCELHEQNAHHDGWSVTGTLML